MGIEDKINNLPRKRRKLLLDLTSIGIIFTMIYGFFIGIQLYYQGKGFMSFFNIGILLPIVVVLVFLFLARSLLEGKKIKTSSSLQPKKPNPNPRSNPRPPEKPRPVYNKPKKPYITAKKPKEFIGSVKCPKCGRLVITHICLNCGWRR